MGHRRTEARGPGPDPAHRSTRYHPPVAHVLLAVTTALVAMTATRDGVQTVTPMTDAVRTQVAPNGRLRAGLNYGNFLLVSTRAPEHTGVAPDLARELARRAGATVEFIGYTNAWLVADAAKDQAWDVAFIGAEPARASLITFTPAYVEIEATYVVPCEGGESRGGQAVGLGRHRHVIARDVDDVHASGECAPRACTVRLHRASSGACSGSPALTTTPHRRDLTRRAGARPEVCRPPRRSDQSCRGRR